MFSYNVYIGYPSYSQLDDGLQFISDFRYDKGNPKLKSSYNHELSLFGSYRDFMLQCDFDIIKDGILSWFEIMKSQRTVVSTEVNHSYTSLYTSINYSPTFFSIWKPSWNLWINKQWINYGGMSYNRPQIGLQWKNLITLPRQWYLTFNASGNLKGNADTYMANSRLQLNATVDKIYKNWHFKLYVSDIFNAKEKGYSQYQNLVTTHFVNYRQPVIGFSVYFSFNQSESKYKGKGAGSSELNRL